MSLYNTFIPSTANSVPSTVTNCIGKPSAACDSIVGSSMTGNGFCSTPGNQNNTVCGCVNNILPCPNKLSPFCANNNGAYLPSYMSNGNNDDSCPDNMCINSIDETTGGNLSNVVQACGGSSSDLGGIIQFLSSHPLVLLVILFVVVIFLNIITIKIFNKLP
jgi:hypothetical protein